MSWEDMRKKEHFLEVRGYDETMLHYGFDDYGFVNRLSLLGFCLRISRIN